jgi:signal transduction histidine kinase
MTAQLTVPIKREQRVIGAIAVETANSVGFEREHVALIERLADHAAIAIDNARLFEQVQKANAAKTEFISFVSHELKQPMTSIKGYSDLLIKGVGGPLNEQQAQFVNVIRRNTGRMDRIVQDLLDVSRIEGGRFRLEMGPVAPEEIVAEATQAFKQEIAAKNQELVIEVSEGLPTVTGDRGRLIQVLTNLISNATKYTPEGGKITVRADVVSDLGTFFISWNVLDTGIGVAPEEIEHLFTKYFRSQRSAVRSVQGTGLGLVITRSIVEMHGGTVSVVSEAGKGSTFSFTVPVAAV